jgi:tRNA nucleotidyltransferase (CCA-adding enzyme)
MDSKLEKVIMHVLERIKPNAYEREKIEKTTQLVKKRVISEVKRGDSNAAVEVGGSVAKDTWLSGEADIDVFILFPESISKSMLGEIGLHIAKEAMKGFPLKERFAEHPYLETYIDGIRINIVPCYKVDKGKWKSAADRSPFHTEYVRTKLSQEELRDEIRLLKRFTKGVGVYGAEIKVGGFSGYLCELLVLGYHSFIRTLNEISKWKLGKLVDVEKLYEGKHHEALRYFDATLMVIDPVDENRNVAAAVSKEKLGELITAARCFLEKPENSFFYPNETILQSSNVLIEKLTKLKSDLVFVIFRCETEVPDILWGQLYKTNRALKRLLKQYDFSVLRSSVWSDEEGVNVLIFEVETKDIPPSKRHMGPQFDSKEARDFLNKHLGEENTVSRPWIEGNRWIVGISRGYVNAISLLNEKLEDGGRSIGVASKFVENIKDSEIYVNKEIVKFYISNKGFAKFLSEFLHSKPNWID